MYSLYGYVVFLLFISVIAKPPDKDRVFDEDLSDVSHHMDEDDHDVDYDHDAFLGKDESSKYKDLTPEESKERLGKIVEKIDTNRDGKVSPDELKHWIQLQSQRYLRDDTDKSWSEYKVDNGKLSFDNYKAKAYEDGSENEVESIARDQRRWTKADVDGDNFLSKEEFFDFLHPEESEHMRDIVIQETMDDIDKNKDGYIDLDEYIRDMWAPDKSEQEEEPDWVRTERNQFGEHRDANKDGRLDKEEIGNWILPRDHNHVTSETEHLMEQADGNKDGYLTKDEILSKYDVFVGSQATDFGDALTRHVEL